MLCILSMGLYFLVWLDHAAKHIGRFKELSDVIVANRKADCLRDVDEKCFSRDLFGDN